MAEDEGRYGVGLAMPFGFGASDLKTATGTRLLEFDLALELATKQNEMPYENGRGSRVHLLKHTKMGRSARQAAASHLVQEALAADPRVSVGDTVVSGTGGDVAISTAYAERRYTGSGGEGRIDYEVPA
jgi:hypothetical protein